MKLKEFIQANKASLEREQMSAKADANFEQLLKSKLHQPKKVKLRYLKYISVAACLAMIVSTLFWYQSYAENQQDKKELLANLQDDSAGKRLEGIYKFNDEYKKEDTKIINTLVKVLHKDTNANVKIATIDALLKFPKNEKIRINLIKALEKEETPLVQIKLIKAVSFLRENRAKKPLKKIINNSQTFPIVKANADLAMLEFNK